MYKQMVIRFLQVAGDHLCLTLVVCPQNQDCSDRTLTILVQMDKATDSHSNIA
jgi:hypothetical protein